MAATVAGAWLVPLAPAWSGPLPVTEVAPGVFVHAGAHAETDAANDGDIANCGFVVGTDAVAVIDTGGSPSVGRRLREAILARTGRPIRYVVNTHAHPDHVGGNEAFLPDGPAFVGHANLPAALAARRDHDRRAYEAATGRPAGDRGPVAPTVTVGDRMEIDLGGRVLELVAHPVAHTDHDLSVLDHGTATLWTGDLVFQERAPAVDGSALGWIAVLDALARVPARLAIPGHGPPASPWPDAAADLRRYLEGIVTDIRAVQKAGGTIQQAVATVPPAGGTAWRLIESYHPRNVTAVFAELEWE